MQMKRTILVGVAALLVAVAVGVLTSMSTLVVPTGAVTSASAAPLPAGDAVKGSYIFALAAGCGCHGANLAGFKAGGPPFGEQFSGPFGTIPAPNITQDKATGIGGWTDDQIANAIRNGVDNQGNALFPIMPSAAYHFVSDGDIADLVAFLRTVPPISNAVPDRKLAGPVPPFPPLPPSPATAPTGTGPDRGRYIASALGSCNDCHTPTSPTGGPDMSKLLSGTFVPAVADGKFPVGPNITPDTATGIGDWTNQQIADYLQKGVGPNGRQPDNFMQEVVFGGFRGLGFNKLTDDDAAALAAFLKSIPAVSNVPVAPPVPPAGAPAPAPAAAPSPGGGPNAGAAVPLGGVITGILPAGQSTFFSFFFPGLGDQGVLLNFSPSNLDNASQSIAGFNVFFSGQQIGEGTLSGLPFGSRYYRVGGGAKFLTIQVFNNAQQPIGIAIAPVGSNFPPGSLTPPNP